MNRTLESRLHETNPRHSDMVDAFAYAIAAQEARIHDGYVLLYVRAKPRWLPELVYRWLLGKLLVLANFKR